MTRSFNLAQRLYIDDDGALCEIASMFDASGYEVEDPADCTWFVVKRSDTEWFVDDVGETHEVARA